MATVPPKVLPKAVQSMSIGEQMTVNPQEPTHSQLELINLQPPRMELRPPNLILNKQRLLDTLSEVLEAGSLVDLKAQLTSLKASLSSSRQDTVGLVNIDANGDTVTVRRDVFVGEVDQILASQTIERAQYYVTHLRSGIADTRTSKVNDINLGRWKEYDEVLTDSLWILPKRDTSGAHVGEYWGNFVPQIPRQMMIRYTKKGDWVLDAFVGSGTTLIECKRLGRNGLGIELNPSVVKRSTELIGRESNRWNVTTEVIQGDNRSVDLRTHLERHGVTQVQLLIMHPPYHDIIRFSTDERDLSNAGSTSDFLSMFAQSVEASTRFLQKGRYFALVIGDKYTKGEWVPLGFLCMAEVLKRGYTLKAIIVKNFDETRGKRNQQELWRYRALVGGFYVFKHEYVMLFKKS